MTTQLQPVNFHNDTLFIIDHHGHPYVPLRPIVENMGLDWKSQHAKIISRQERFCVVMITTQMPSDDQRREMVCLPLRKLAAWLYSIHPDKVAPQLRDWIILYQNDCDEVLWNYWTKGYGITDRQAATMTLVDTQDYMELLQDHNRMLRDKLAQARMSIPRPYSKQDDETALSLRAQGRSYRDIGMALERGWRSVKNRLHRLQAQGRDRQLRLFDGGR